jgi:hypothetical protein
MADDKTPEFSREEAQGLLFHGAPQPSVVEPAVQKASNIPVPPPVSIKSVEKGTPVAKAPNALSLVKTVSEANKELQQSVEAPKPPSAFGGLIDDLTANWKPLTIGAGAVITGMAAKRYLGRKDSTQPTAPTVKVEPTFATPEETATFKPVEQPAAPSKLAVESEAKFGVPLSDVENHFGVKVTNIKDAEILSNNYKNSLPSGTIPGIPSAVNPMNQLTVQPPAPQLIQPKSAAPAPSLQQAVEAGGDVGQALKTDVAKMVDEAAAVPPPAELRTGTGKIAYAGTGPAPTISSRTGQPQFKKEYPSLADVPQGYALVPGAQYIDPLRQDLGQTEYTKAFTGRDFPLTDAEARAQAKEINRSLGRATREEAKAAGLPYGEITPGITKRTTENKKLVKIIGKAGLSGALVSLADLALAKTPEEKANAGVGLLGAILPPGMDINAAGAPGVQQQQINQAALLGSPYAQTEWAKNQRLRERAGAGRGIAPPSAYQR